MSGSSVTVEEERYTVTVEEDPTYVTVQFPGPQGPPGTVIFDGGPPNRGAGAIAIDCGEVS